MPYTAPLGERFWAKVAKAGPDDCWLWTGASTQAPHAKDRYGVIWSEGRNERAHRVSLVLAGRLRPDGAQVDHLCRNTLCVNPTHLEWVDARTNTRRSNNPPAQNARKTRCPQGHLLSGDNLYVNPSRERCCRACRRVAARRSYHARRVVA